jgi:carbon starvation protein
MITPRAKILFLLILLMALTIVLAIFGLVIASIFNMYPESVLSVWIEIPIAVAIGYWVYKRNGTLLIPSLIALCMLYVAIYIGVYHWQIELPHIQAWGVWGSPVVVWTVILLIYCFIASVLPVWTLLQPRDYINSHQLVVALVLLVGGLTFAGATGQAKLNSAPAIVTSPVKGAPPIMPFLFITIACGAVSGFHCLVSSGTSSKQVSSELDAQTVGYGAMLLEGALAVIVILACTAGVGIGKFQRETSATGGYAYTQVMVSGDRPLAGQEAWARRYSSAWNDFGLGDKVGAFVEGGANFLSTIGIPIKLAIGIVAVLVASFAATTLDTATRLQRYVIQELASSLYRQPTQNPQASTLSAFAVRTVNLLSVLLQNRYLATLTAVTLGGAVALFAGETPGAGGLILWPLFGATNQLLAGLALMVIVFYLWRRGKPVWFVVLPMLLMFVMPIWALGWQLFSSPSATGGWFWPLWGMLSGTEAWEWQKTHMWCAIGVATLLLQFWMIAEAVLLWPRAKGVLEESLPPLSKPRLATQS